MYHNRTRKRKFRTNDRPFRKRNGSESHRNNSPNSIPNGQIRSGHFRGHQNARQLIEKYSNLAKEALSIGDRILSENYLQHADHFMRIIEDKNRSRNQSKVSLVDIPVKNNENLSDSDDINKNSESKKKD